MSKPRDTPEAIDFIGPVAPSIGSKRRRIGLIAFSLAAFTVLIAWIVFHWSTGRYLELTDDAYLRAPAVAISSPKTGFVAKILVAENTNVAKGQPLIEIEAVEATETVGRSDSPLIIRASVAGRVGNLSAQLGQFVQPGARLMSVFRLDSLYVTANFRETQIGMMRSGQSVNIEVDALPGVRLRGHLASIAPGTRAEFAVVPAENATGNFTKIVQRVPVRIELDSKVDSQASVVSGVSATVTVDTRSAANPGDELARPKDSLRQTVR